MPNRDSEITIEPVPLESPEPSSDEAALTGALLETEHSGDSLPERSPLNAIDKRLSMATSPQEASEWLRVRRHFMEYEEGRKDRSYARSMYKIYLLIQVMFSIATCGLGLWLIFKDLMFPGFFLLGAGLFVIVEDYVRLFFRRFGDGPR